MGEKGERKKSGGDYTSKHSNEELLSSPALADLGITKKQSSDWQQLAEVLKMDGTLMLYQQFYTYESRSSQGFSRFIAFPCQMGVSNPSRRYAYSTCFDHHALCSRR
jgi:hypothetical protein